MDRSSATNNGSAVRWGAICIFALASTWNYLDRQLLSAAAPRIRSEFHLSNMGYGWLVAAFGLAYALASPALGWFLDWVGLEVGICWAVGFWSIAAMICGWTRTFAQLVFSRVLLGVGESAGVPAAGKVNTIYLKPENRAIGAAVTQVGITIGGVAAPLVMNGFVDWRSPFFICGALGLAWIPVWLGVRRKVPPIARVARRTTGGIELFADRRLVLLAAANILWMVGYVLWSSWTTVYLVDTFHLSTRQANGYAWFPPFAATAGGFLGGWLSRRFMSRGAPALQSRISAIGWSAIGCLVSIAGPFCHSPLLVTLVAGASYFWTLAGSVNLYTIPLDIWGGERAGVAISFLVFAYGMLMLGISPLIGAVVDRFGFAPVCWMIAIPPMFAWLLLKKIRGSHEAAPESSSRSETGSTTA